MTKRDLLNFAFKWKGTLLGWSMLTVALVTTSVFLGAPRLEARATVVVERNRMPIILEQGQGTNWNSLLMAEVMNTEREIVRSRVVVEAVVDNLGLAKGDREEAGKTSPEPWRPLLDRLNQYLVTYGLVHPLPAREQWVLRITNNLSVKALIESNVLELTYADVDPRRAAAIVNAVIDRYQSHRLSVYAARGASEFFQAQMKEAWDALQKVRDQLTQYKSKQSLPFFDENKKRLIAQVASLNDRLTASRQTLIDTQNVYGDSYPKVIALKVQNKDLQDQIAQSNRALVEMERQDGALRSLEAAVQLQEKTYTDAKNRYDDQRLREQANVTTGNVRVVEYAQVPKVPARSRMFLIGASILAGLALAFLIAMIREYFDNHVNDPETAERILKAPVLGSIAKVKF